jgi:hypothetical protein
MYVRVCTVVHYKQYILLQIIPPNGVGGSGGGGSISEDDNADCLRLTIISEDCISWILSQRRNDKKIRGGCTVSCSKNGEGIPKM